MNVLVVGASGAIGDGGGVWSFIRLDDTATATVLALEHDGPAVYNIVDDEPAPSGSGCRSSRESSERSHPSASRACSPGSSRARRPS